MFASIAAALRGEGQGEDLPYDDNDDDDDDDDDGTDDDGDGTDDDGDGTGYDDDDGDNHKIIFDLVLGECWFGT